jgi:hypothetical protein
MNTVNRDRHCSPWHFSAKLSEVYCYFTSVVRQKPVYNATDGVQPALAPMHSGFTKEWVSPVSSKRVCHLDLIILHLSLGAELFWQDCCG